MCYVSFSVACCFPRAWLPPPSRPPNTNPWDFKSQWPVASGQRTGKSRDDRSQNCSNFPIKNGSFGGCLILERRGYLSLYLFISIYIYIYTHIFLLCLDFGHPIFNNYWESVAYIGHDCSLSMELWHVVTSPRIWVIRLLTLAQRGIERWEVNTINTFFNPLNTRLRPLSSANPITSQYQIQPVQAQRIKKSNFWAKFWIEGTKYSGKWMEKDGMILIALFPP